MNNKVFEFFEQICSVPHGSDNTKQISDLCCKFAESRGLEYYQDKHNNVIIYKPGSAGCEDKAPVIIQGHMDMVCVKAPGCPIDLEREGLRLMRDDKSIWADGTSLGADDGIAVAMAMAVLDDEGLRHPPIEAVFTVNEETGMDGAHGLDVSRLRGRRMLNIDSEAEWIITAGCAGGIRVYGNFALKSSPCKERLVELCISGLTGGHSGSEIHKGRANSNKLMGRLLSQLQKISTVRLVSLAGGEKDNAIAAKTSAFVAVDGDCLDAVKALAADCEEQFGREYCKTDKGIEIIVSEAGESVVAAGAAESSDIIRMLCAVPDGVCSMSPDIDGLVQTSLNLGVVSTENDNVAMTFCLRSSLSSELLELENEISRIIEIYNGSAATGGAYPAWEYKSASELRSVAIEACQRLYGRTPRVEVIHAGLECGLFTDRIADLDCISFGPDIHDIHTVYEKLDIASAERTYALLVEILRTI